MLLTRWCASLATSGWPATGGASVLADGGSEAGNKVGFAPCNSLNCVAFMPCGA